MNSLKKIYQILLKELGHQGWWPVTPLGNCRSCGDSLPIYGLKAKTEKQKLEIIFGAILTQNTQWKPNVENSIIRLNEKNLIDVDKIIEISDKELGELIRSSGYYNQKTKALKAMALFLKENPINKLVKMDLVELRKLILSVHGVGPETADCILLYALDKPIFVIDAYTKRIMHKLGFKEESYDDLKELFEDNLDKDVSLYKEYHALLVELGKRKEFDYSTLLKVCN
jgi:endonuclease III related protein